MTPCLSLLVGPYWVLNPFHLTVLTAKSEDYTTVPQHLPSTAGKAGSSLIPLSGKLKLMYSPGLNLLRKFVPPSEFCSVWFCCPQELHPALPKEGTHKGIVSKCCHMAFYETSTFFYIFISDRSNSLHPKALAVQ